MSRPAAVTIDVNAFLHNLNRVREYAPKSNIMAVVKANAYGHDVKKIIAPLRAADAAGVCCIEEGIDLRAAGMTSAIVLMEGIFNSEEIVGVAEHGFEIVLHNWHQIEMLAKARLTKPISAWLKLNSGMHRLGFAPDEFSHAWQRLQTIPNIIKYPRLMSHFACADEINNPYTRQQLACFQATTKGLPGERTLANSAGIIAWPASHQDWVRPGIMLYGISPFSDKIGDDFGLKPVMTLRSQLIAVRECQAGETIGYGANWCCPKPMRMGVVAVGYGDGYPRHATNGTPVLVNKKRVPLVGTVSMDMLTVDLSSLPEAGIGNEVVLWGEGLPIEQVAHHAGTIGYELVCRVNKRVNND